MGRQIFVPLLILFGIALSVASWIASLDPLTIGLGLTAALFIFVFSLLLLLRARFRTAFLVAATLAVPAYAYVMWEYAELMMFVQYVAAPVFMLISLVMGWIALTSDIFDAESSDGRDEFNVSWIRSRLSARKSQQSKDPDIVAVDRVEKKGRNAGNVPTFETDTSLIVLGQTGKGKSTFIKERLLHWHPYDGVIAHALSNTSGPNEFESFISQWNPDDDVIRLSSQGSTHRWDPFMDFSASMQDMRSIAVGMWESRNTVETGWSDSAKSLLTAALAVTKAQYDDFAKLPNVLEQGPQEIIKKAQSNPNAAVVLSGLDGMSEKDLGTAHSNLMNEISPLLLSELFDDDLPRFSLRGYFDGKQQDNVVLDNIRQDKFARPYWRFFLQTAIDLSMDSDSRQRFLLDEVDKIPKIDNLDELASAGRSDGSTAIIAAQDRSQIESIYGTMTDSIYANCPNRVVFNVGDGETAEWVLSGLGKHELEQRTVTRSTGNLETEEARSISETRRDSVPVSEHELMSLEIGEALIQSPDGWWLSKLTEPELDL